MPEAQRQWVLLSKERTIIRQLTGQPFPLVNQFGMIVSWTDIFYRYLPVVLESATALFGTEAFDAANPATLLQPPRSPFSCDDVYRTYTCLIAQQLIMWAVSRHTGLNRIRTWLSTKHPVSSAARRAHELVMRLAANLTDDTNGMGVEHVFDTAQGEGLTRRRYLVLGERRALTDELDELRLFRLFGVSGLLLGLMLVEVWAGCVQRGFPAYMGGWLAAA
ncbi:unnamed protein product [Vitrella brassicaformis CCMP3155]|uniref:Uncharacterized protein n=1 Tax=Vitrella brassicaformis (strain CCMP3155) TaxID=1169540 RepID=A0A0G4F9S3_VITBC|nr:unnamed protein product [Vitrella brassicaformis CCMP3155]|eukprot:CEM09707.1 unnamed protein product [Vitrella brassicaformis CCMP3155]